MTLPRELEQLLDEIVSFTDDQECRMDDIISVFEYPDTYFLEGMERPEQEAKFRKLLSKFYYSVLYGTKKCYGWRYLVGEDMAEQHENEEWWMKVAISTFERLVCAEKVAFRKVLKGVDGGIRAMLTRFGAQLKKAHIAQKISVLMLKKWGPFGPEGWPIDRYMPAINAYRDRFRAFLPDEYLEESDVFWFTHFYSILSHHAEIIRGGKAIFDHLLEKRISEGGSG